MVTPTIQLDRAAQRKRTSVYRIDPGATTIWMTCCKLNWTLQKHDQQKKKNRKNKGSLLQQLEHNGFLDNSSIGRI